MRPLKPLSLKPLDKPLPPPDFELDGILERGTVTILSGDTSAAKSMVALSMCVAVLRGEPWLGRATKRGRVIYSDAEMHPRIVYERLHGFGVRGSDARSFTYLSRAGINLDSRESVKELRELCAQRKASVLVLDALMGHTGADINDNTAAVKLYTEALRPLTADGAGLALLLVHHESKPARGVPRNSSLATMGARQYVGQADYQLTLERAPRPFTTTATEPDGSRIETYRVRLRQPKRRDAGDTAGVEPLCVVSRHAPDGTLDTLAVEPDTAAGVSNAVGQDRRQELAERIKAHIATNGESSTKDIAAAVKLDPTSGSFKRALKAAIALGVENPSKGVYRAPRR
jgi:AAA domain